MSYLLNLVYLIALCLASPWLLYNAIRKGKYRQGWAAKFLTIRYGGKHTFDRVRLFFIGLIMGELMAIFIWPIISVITGIDIGQITLNRYNT